jgi:hypothetical protein
MEAVRYSFLCPKFVRSRLRSEQMKLLKKVGQKIEI